MGKFSWLQVILGVKMGFWLITNWLFLSFLGLAWTRSFLLSR